MYPEWLPLLCGQYVPEGSRNSIVFNCRLDSNICALFIENKLLKSMEYYFCL